MTDENVPATAIALRGLCAGSVGRTRDGQLATLISCFGFRAHWALDHAQQALDETPRSMRFMTDMRGHYRTQDLTTFPRWSDVPPAMPLDIVEVVLRNYIRSSAFDPDPASYETIECVVVYDAEQDVVCVSGVLGHPRREVFSEEYKQPGVLIHTFDLVIPKPEPTALPGNHAMNQGDA